MSILTLRRPPDRSPVQAPARRPTADRPRTTYGLLADQVGHALSDLWRTRVVAIFTFIFPLTFLVIIGAMAGDASVPAAERVEVMQYATPAAAVMGALYGSFPTMATSLAVLRERGVLKRLAGTPVPTWLFLLGRVIASAVFALGSLAMMLAVGVVAYDVEVQWATIPATVVTSLVAVVCFAALGVAVAGLARSSSLASAASIGAAVVLSLLSGLMGYDDMPAWADRIAVVFPLKHVHEALVDQFDPFAAGAGWDLGALAILAAWTVLGMLVAARTLTAEPARSGGRARRRIETSVGGPPAPAPAPGVRTAAPVAEEVGRPARLRLVADQARWATTAALRDMGWVFFAIALPVGLYAFNAGLMGDAGPETGPPLHLQLAAGMIGWAAVVTGLVNLPEALARERDSGVLKRLRGTPAPLSLHVAGRLLSALGLVLVTAALIVVAGLVWFDLDIAAAGLPLAAGLLVLGTASLTAIGLLLAAVLPSAKAVTAVGLAIGLPLAFVSDIFAIGLTPRWMDVAGSLLPARHLAHSLSAALDPGGVGVSWVGIAVMVAWLVVAGALALRLFRRADRG